MNVWHDTVDAPRSPRRVSPRQEVEIVVGTWPIGPGQAVSVSCSADDVDGHRTEGAATGVWQRNTDVNSYWTARIGPFADGDRVTYTVQGSRSRSAAKTQESTSGLECRSIAMEPRGSPLNRWT